MIAICQNCGDLKEKPERRCHSCKMEPIGEEQLAIALLHSVMFLPNAQLSQLASQIRAGQTVVFPPTLYQQALRQARVQRLAASRSKFIITGCSLLFAITIGLFCYFSPAIQFKWASMRNRLTVYEKFLDRFPSSSDASAAEEKILSFKEDGIWEMAVRSGKIGQLRNYRDTYPNGENIERADAMITEHADRVWDRVKETRSPATIRNFIDDYPESTRLDEARKMVVAPEVAKFAVVIAEEEKRIKRHLRTWQEIEQLVGEHQTFGTPSPLVKLEPTEGVDSDAGSGFAWPLPPIPFSGNRAWTSRENGKTISARCVGVHDGKVQLLIGKKESSVELERLSEADRHYAKVWVELRKDFQPRPEHITVPTSVSAAAWESDVRSFAQDDDTRRWKYQTESFEFESDVKLSKEVLRRASRQFEIVNRVVPALGLIPHPKSPPEKFFKVRLFGERTAYHDAGGPLNSAGVFFFWHEDKEKEGVSFVSIPNLGVGKDRRRSLRTLLHETTHQVMHHQLPKMPIWAAEGLADYIASRHYERDELKLSVAADQLDSYYERKFSREWNGKIPWKNPSEMMDLSHKTFMKAMPRAVPRQNPAANPITSNYVRSMLLVNFLLHLDGPQGAERFAAYLENFAAGLIDAQLYMTAYNEALEKYNQKIDECRKTAESWNAALAAYDRQLGQWTAAMAVFDRGEGAPREPPVRPPLPDKSKYVIIQPSLPGILENPRMEGHLAQSSIEKHARAILLNGRSQNEFDESVKEKYLEFGLEFD